MLGGRHSKVVVSTLREARGLLPLIEEKVVSEVSRIPLHVTPYPLPTILSLSLAHLYT